MDYTLSQSSAIESNELINSFEKATNFVLLISLLNSLKYSSEMADEIIENSVSSSMCFL